MNLSIRKVVFALAVAISSSTTMFVQPNSVSALPPVGSDPSTDEDNPVVCTTDLAVKEIKYQLVRRDSATKGRVRVTGVIQNIGHKKYVQSSRYGHNFNLLESDMSTRIPPTLRPYTDHFHKRVPNLSPGEKMEFSYEINWNDGINFPSFYELNINYYETSGSRSVNPDCNLNNNYIKRSSGAVKGFFPPMVGTQR